MSALEQIVKRVKPLDEAAMSAARQRQDQLTKPRGSLGVLEDLAVQIAGITGCPLPSIDDAVILTMAADHGVVSEGVSLYPQEVTRQMVFNFLNGGAAINVLARMVNARVVIVDMGVKGGFPPANGLQCKMIDFGTQNMCRGPAMTAGQARNSIQAGIDIVESEIDKGLDILATGEMGIGNTTAASAIISAVTRTPVSQVTGRGTGVGDEQLQHKIKIIEKALSINKPDPDNALDVLSKVGGFEIGGLAGAIIACAAHRIPVLVDGFISGSAALIAAGICPQARDYLIASHRSAENGHSVCLGYLKVSPLLDLSMRLGEGTGAAIGIFLAQAAVNLHTQMATFASANVSDIK
ncbi:MAG: nicotinate-nucleotide--dimethylbenzimidazole phosphoribosyltransferase [Dehalococcoidia bacterium]